MKVGFIGLGKLGKDVSEVMSKYYDVTGFDINPNNGAKIKQAKNLKELCFRKNIIFVAVQTPHDPKYDGKAPTSHLTPKDFDYSIVKNVIQEINRFVNRNTLVVLISTVLPGITRKEILPLLTNSRFIYNPYLIAQGTVKWDMKNPELIIIGTKEGRKTNDVAKLIKFYQPIIKKKNYRKVIGTYEEAESIKIFYNTFISTKLAFVNLIQDVAERIENINSELVCDTLANSTMRIISPKYMKPGFGDGGGCHPRDNIALRSLASRLNLGYDYFDAIMKAREIQAKNMALKCLKYKKDVVILGKSFKPGIDQEAGSPSMLVGWYVKKYGVKQKLFYDKAPSKTKPYVYLIHDNTKKYKFNKNSIVIDPYRKIKKSKDFKVIHYGNSRKDSIF